MNELYTYNRPGWTDYVDELHKSARECFLLTHINYATNLAKNVKDAQLKISSVEKRHRMMKRYHQEKKVSMNFFRCEECVEWLLKVQEQGVEIVGLQTEKSLLEEQVQEMSEAHVKITKTDGKAYCPDIQDDGV